jgi:glutamate N-acetyltransferase/amino-acid N-acetyltransferase
MASNHLKITCLNFAEPATKARRVRKPQALFKTQVKFYSAPVDGFIPSSKRKYVPTSGTYPKGFLVSGTHVGVKPTNTRFPDLALITSTTPCSAAAVFTKNKFQAAPVVVSRENLRNCKGEGIRAIIVNSGCANAVTGRGGYEDAISMASAVDACSTSDTSSSGTLVMSTGVIGQRLPIAQILSKISTAYDMVSDTHISWLNTARAICTTDTFPKLLSTSFSLPSSPSTTYSLAGMTKGAGMIHPNMATLLGILCTDALIPATALQPLLTHAVDRSFNAISIDGDTSTNDTVALLANGAAGGIPITSLDSPDGHKMQEVLTNFTQTLSQLVVRDGEGATKFVHVRVCNAASFSDAKAIASTIARSPLVKTALYGKDANWGRILCAIGYTPNLSDADTVLPERTSVSFVPVDASAELKLLVNGEPEAVDEERAKVILEAEDLEIRVNLGTGREEASYWFCDFSHEYVTINGDYRT